MVAQAEGKAQGNEKVIEEVHFTVILRFSFRLFVMTILPPDSCKMKLESVRQFVDISDLSQME